MLTETARVVALEDDAVWVETLRQSSCGSCAARSGCGHGMLNRAAPGSSRGLVRAKHDKDSRLRLSIHDQVQIGIPETFFLRGVFLLYCLPLLLTVGAAAATDAYLPVEGLSQAARDLRVTCGAALGLVVGLSFVRLAAERTGNRSAHAPRVVAKISAPDSGC